MKLFLLFILLNLSSLSSAQTKTLDCPEQITIKLETEQSVSFCKFDSLMVSKDCYDKKESCPLVSEFKIKKQIIVKSKPIKQAMNHNPGSVICNKLGWKVLMGTLFDQSQVCTCEHPSGALVICTTMM